MSLVSPVRPTRDCAPRLIDFDAERASYRIEVPERFNAVLDIVEAWASEDPDALAVLSVDECRGDRRGAVGGRSGTCLEGGGASVVGPGGGQGGPRLRDAAADCGMVRSVARRDADRCDPNAGPEPADLEGHCVPLRADGRNGSDHRRGRHEQGRSSRHKFGDPSLRRRRATGLAVVRRAL